jgi:hypothetical protein
MIPLHPFSETLWPFDPLVATLLAFTHYKAGFVPGWVLGTARLVSWREYTTRSVRMLFFRWLQLPSFHGYSISQRINPPGIQTIDGMWEFFHKLLGIFPHHTRRIISQKRPLWGNFRFFVGKNSD